MAERSLTFSPQVAAILGPEGMRRYQAKFRDDAAPRRPAGQQPSRRLRPPPPSHTHIHLHDDEPPRPPASLTDAQRKDLRDLQRRARSRRRRARDQLSEEAWSTGAKREDAQRRAKDWEPAGGWPAPRPPGYAGTGISIPQYQAINDRHYGQTMRNGQEEAVQGSVKKGGDPRDPAAAGPPYTVPPQRQAASLREPREGRIEHTFDRVTPTPATINAANKRFAAAGGWGPR